MLRGRLRESDQLHRRHGAALPLETRHDEFTPDIPENQILATALRRMLDVPRVDDESARPGGVAVNGFLFDMAKVFEGFLTEALREELQGGYGGRVAGQDRLTFEESGRLTLIPDIVWYIDGRPVAVVDAKYAVEKPRGAPTQHLYQLLAYCTVLGLRRGYLVYAEGHGEPTSCVVRGAGIDIVGRSLDLDQPPRLLLDQIRHLAATISADVQALPLRDIVEPPP